MPFELYLSTVLQMGELTAYPPITTGSIALIKLPEGASQISFNWISGTSAGAWEPRRAESRFNPIPGTSPYPYPHTSGDAIRYLRLSQDERDYDQVLSSLDFQNKGWMPPARGDFLGTSSGLGSPFAQISFGPFDLGPGETVEWVIALVGGDSVHTDPTAYDRLFDPLNPYPFYNQLNFKPLIENAKWASWVYDNPGIDTDGDGYRGEFEICNANPESGFTGDTLWYQGDGIPDYRADLPPPAPPTRIYTSEGKLVIRWNGFDVEKTIDPFTRKMDFQGYKVYMGRDPRLESLVLHSQWDKEDYIALKFVLRADGGGDWVPDSEPLSLDSITDYYDLPEHPLSYTRQKSYNFNNSNYYFEKQDNNVSDLSNLAGIHKAYPDALPPANADSLLWTESEYTTEHGRKFPKYTEYEYIIDGILPSVPYYVGVTAFDHGFVLGGMPPQESDPVKTLQQTLALPSADSVEANNLDAYCYPNPYRIDGNYIERGYENRDNSIPDQKAGRIHFANLPRKCTISIYSLDGDRIWSYDHNPATYSANDMHAEWDLISRNRQLVVSGLYYWVVESETRTQIGKLMILK